MANHMLYPSCCWTECFTTLGAGVCLTGGTLPPTKVLSHHQWNILVWTECWCRWFFCFTPVNDSSIQLRSHFTPDLLNHETSSIHHLHIYMPYIAMSWIISPFPTLPKLSHVPGTAMSEIGLGALSAAMRFAPWEQTMKLLSSLVSALGSRFPHFPTKVPWVSGWFKEWTLFPWGISTAKTVVPQRSDHEEHFMLDWPLFCRHNPCYNTLSIVLLTSST